MQLLDSHPKVKAYGEPFTGADQGKNKTPRGADPRLWPPLRYNDFKENSKWPRPFCTGNYLAEFHRINQGHENIAYKVMYEQLIRETPELVVLLPLHKYKIIHLERKNFLDAAISQQIMRRQGKAHSFSDKEGLNSFTVDIDELLDDLRRRSRYSWLAHKIVAAWPIPKLHIYYEDLCKRTEDTLQKTAFFLGVKEHVYNPDTMFRKTVKKQHSAFLSNYEDVVRALSGTRYERFLQTSGEVMS